MNNQSVLSISRKNALTLTAFGFICVLLVTLVYLLTRPAIELQKQQALLNTLTEVLNPQQFDNNPIENCVKASTDSPLLGNIYRATLNKQPYALIFTTETKQGYNGLIEMIIAVDQKQNIQGVRVLNHQETPGLGDKIDLIKSDWILTLSNKLLNTDTQEDWYVKKDGGNYDQFTGATITPRAVLAQVREASLYINHHFQSIFALPNECITGKVTANIKSDVDAQTPIDINEATLEQSTL